MSYDLEGNQGAMCSSLSTDSDTTSNGYYQARYWNIDTSKYTGLFGLGDNMIEFYIVLNSDSFIDDLVSSYEGPPKYVGLITLFRAYYDKNSGVILRYDLEAGNDFRINDLEKEKKRIENTEYNEDLQKLERYNSNLYLLDEDGAVAESGVKYGRYASSDVLLCDLVQILSNYEKFDFHMKSKKRK